MNEDLGTRLVRAGVLTRARLTRVTADPPRYEAELLDRLVESGIEAEALAGFFLAEGHGPLVRAERLLEADAALLEAVPGEWAHAACALPLEREATGVLVAMAAPTDERARADLERILGMPIHAVTASIDELRLSLEEAYPNVTPATRAASLETASASAAWADESAHESNTASGSPPPVSTTTPESTDAHHDQRNDVASGPWHARLDPAPGTETPLETEADEIIELVRKRPSLITPSRPIAESEPPEAVPLVRTKPWPTPAAGVLRASDEQLDRDDRWSAPPAEPTESDASHVLGNRAHALRLGPQRPSVAGGTDELAIAAIRSAPSRDRVVEALCTSAARLGRLALFLALRRGVLQGWDGRGGSLSPEAIRNLRIAIATPSMFQHVVQTLRPHDGAYGPTAADQAFRAAIGARVEATVLVVPVTPGGRVAGVLVVDEPTAGPFVRERIAQACRAAADAFERLIDARRR
ncbi:MAG: hypothetical protein NZ898_12975 [Myxococcota bacterium]|nr:hypothetical protein [Myxococcota bacterium]MDW8361041.1 hypothetical protein [Myxococcales bacterium]